MVAIALLEAALGFEPKYGALQPPAPRDSVCLYVTLTSLKPKDTQTFRTIGAFSVLTRRTEKGRFHCQPNCQLINNSLRLVLPLQLHCNFPERFIACDKLIVESGQLFIIQFAEAVHQFVHYSLRSPLESALTHRELRSTAPRPIC